MTDEHHLVYNVVEDEMRIDACRYHYDAEGRAPGRGAPCRDRSWTCWSTAPELGPLATASTDSSRLSIKLVVGLAGRGDAAEVAVLEPVAAAVG
ncbi:hypothetical protein [Actinomycetospora sp. CA-084318]|uniref:hypothetical protein n=1 Tax=Actinomycetospora sp. CA-084318 TaxID=3239892 RepID=UPI003D95E380